MSRFTRATLLLLAAITLASGNAHSYVFGVTLDPLTPNGPAIGAQLDWVITHVELGSTPLELAARADLSAPLSFDLYPNVGAGLTVRLPYDAATPYLGTGAGLWWSRLDDVPCWDLTWTLHAGVDVPLSAAWSARIEAQAAPLIAAYRVGVGVTFTIGTVDDNDTSER